MSQDYSILELKHIHNVFLSVIDHYPRPVSIQHLLKDDPCLAKKVKCRLLQRSIHRLLKSWVKLGILEDLGRSKQSSSKFYRLASTGELFLKPYRDKATKTQLEKIQSIPNISATSNKYFYILFYAIQTKKEYFTAEDLKNYADYHGYHLSLRSWQRKLNLLAHSEILGSFQPSHQEPINYSIGALSKSRACFFKEEYDMAKIQFEKILVTSGLVENYQTYIDYNRLIFHTLFRKWQSDGFNSKSSVRDFIHKHQYVGSQHY